MTLAERLEHLREIATKQSGEPAQQARAHARRLCDRRGVDIPVWAASEWLLRAVLVAARMPLSGGQPGPRRLRTPACPCHLTRG